MVNLLYQNDHEYKDGKTLYTAKCWNDLASRPFNSLIPVDEYGYSKHIMVSRPGTHADYNKGWECLKLEVSCGDKYFNGSSWTTTPSTFWINFHA